MVVAGCVLLEDLDVAIDSSEDLLVLVSESLDRSALQDETAAVLIRLRFFAGLPIVAAAEILGLSERTAKRTWAYARAWLYEEIRRHSESASTTPSLQQDVA